MNSEKLIKGLAHFFDSSASFRDSVLPESDDIKSYMKKSNQNNILLALIDPTKDALLSKAALLRSLSSGDTAVV
jgi:hypothetical protein